MVQFYIDGNAPTPSAPDTDAAEAERTRHSLREAAAWKNELLQAKREQAAVHLERINTEAERATQAHQQALEEGDFARAAEAQREVATLEVRRANTQSVAERLDRTPAVPADPVEAFAEGRSAQAQDWIRNHPDYAMGGRKTAKLQAAHSDAIAEGIAPDTKEYFKHVDQFLGIDGGGAGSRRRGSDSETLRVRVTDDPNRQLEPGEVRMSKGEYRAATDGSLTWNYDSPDGKHKKGSALGVTEYLRRKGIMKQQPGWFDKLSD
jgi:hypothetical protein